MGDMQMVWGWQPALYLFLGGVGAGAFLVAGILTLVDRGRNKTTISVSMWAAIACLGGGLLLLLSELTNPLRGLLLWQSFSNHASWMTFGAWAALLALVAFALSAVLATRKTESFLLKKWPGFAVRERQVNTVLVSVGMVLAVCVAVYTGMLLMAVPGVPLWNTLLLPCLFAVSAFDTGVALVELASVAMAKREAITRKARVFLEGSVVVLVAVEGVVLLAFSQTMLAGNVTSALSLGSSAETAARSMQMLTSGHLAPCFWGLLVACGLALPLAVAVLCLIRGRKRADMAESQLDGAAARPPRATHAITAVGAVGALVGGCTLRFLVLLAGTHADLVADSLAKLFS